MMTSSAKVVRVPVNTRNFNAMQSTNQKTKKRFRFTKFEDLTMRNIIADVGAHTTMRNKKMKKKRNVFTVVMEFIQLDVRDSYVAPKAKVANDRFDLMIKIRRTDNSRNRKAGGIEEERVEF